MVKLPGRLWWTAEINDDQSFTVVTFIVQDWEYLFRSAMTTGNSSIVNYGPAVDMPGVWIIMGIRYQKA